MVITELSSAKRPWRNLIVAITGLVTGLLTAPAHSLVDLLNLLRGLGGFAMALGGAPFAILIVLMARVLGRADWWRALSLGFVVVMAFQIAIVVAWEVNLVFTGWPEYARNILGGLVGGFLGAGLMTLGALLLGVGPRHIARWMPMIAAGTVAGVLLAIDVHRQADNFWVLYPVWQCVVALLFARALERRGT